MPTLDDLIDAVASAATRLTVADVRNIQHGDAHQECERRVAELDAAKAALLAAAQQGREDSALLDHTYALRAGAGPGLTGRELLRNMVRVERDVAVVDRARGNAGEVPAASATPSSPSHPRSV